MTAWDAGGYSRRGSKCAPGGAQATDMMEAAPAEDSDRSRYDEAAYLRMYPDIGEAIARYHATMAATPTPPLPLGGGGRANDRTDEFGPADNRRVRRKGTGMKLGSSAPPADR